MTSITDDVTELLREILAGDGSREAKAALAAEAIRATSGYRWVGLYDALEAEIAVIAWSGPGAPAFPRFPRTDGLNGAAVASGAPVVVNDVARDPRYLTALETTRAEAIVPVADANGRVVGTLDVESAEIGAFADADLRFLEACADALAPLWR